MSLRKDLIEKAMNAQSKEELAQLFKTENIKLSDDERRHYELMLQRNRINPNHRTGAQELSDDELKDVSGGDMADRNDPKWQVECVICHRSAYFEDMVYGWINAQDVCVCYGECERIAHEQYGFASMSELLSTCVPEYTKVMLADGSEAAISSLKAGDMIMSYDHRTGTMTVNPITVFLDYDGVRERTKVVTLNFSSGYETSFMVEHSYLDMTTGRYELISEKNAEHFIGHEFAFVLGTEIVSRKLESFSSRVRSTGSYEILTESSIDFITDGCISCANSAESFLNMFPFEPGTFRYDLRVIEEQIKAYGVFEAADFPAVPKDVFDALGMKYLKAALACGGISDHDFTVMMDGLSKCMVYAS